MADDKFPPEWDDDVVALLRFHGAPLVGKRQTLMQEAADEIERLRAEVTRLGSFLHPIGVVITVHKGKKYDEEKIAEILRKAREVHRG